MGVVEVLAPFEVLISSCRPALLHVDLRFEPMTWFVSLLVSGLLDSLRKNAHFSFTILSYSGSRPIAASRCVERDLMERDFATNDFFAWPTTYVNTWRMQLSNSSSRDFQYSLLEPPIATGHFIRSA